MADNERANILIVDDLPEKILVLETILEGMSENIVTARSGEEALRKVLDHDFAVVLLDVNMPGMDGFETASYIRRRRRSAHVPIIFVTAFADEVHAAQGYSLGAVDYILSPVNPEVLRTKVKVFVELFRLTQQVRRQADERVALAHEQAARAAAEEATRRSAFLADASNLLSRSLDFDVTLATLARIPVPFLADLAAVALASEDERPTWASLAWSDEAGETFSCAVNEASALLEPLRPTVEQAIRHSRVLHVGEASACHVATLPGGAAFALRQTLVLPLRAHGRTRGVLLLAMGHSGRSYHGADGSLAEDLASRAGMALDNARLYQNIQEGDRRKNEFMAMLAHELRNPLAPLRNAVQVMRLIESGDARLDQARDIIDRQATHMTRLVDDLLDMSRLSSGKILLRKESLNLVDVVRTAAEDYRAILKASGLRLDLDLPPDPLFVLGDQTRLAQMVGNLLHNCNKFTDSGAVTVRVESRADQARIVVLDTGIGMDKPMLARLFDSFSQADRSLDRSRGGLGLGLALVKGLVELHDGTVQAFSPGLQQGTEIVIHLPLAEKPKTAARSDTVASTALAPARVLIIEDNRDAAETLRTLLFLTGHQVEIAHTGQEGIERARSSRPEIILCDIGLPGGLDGYEVARTIRRQPELASTCLVAVTGYGQEADKLRAREAGFDAHCTKPIDFPDLQRRLAALSRGARPCWAKECTPAAASLSDAQDSNHSSKL